MEYEGEFIGIILKIPKETVSLNIEANVMLDDGHFQKVTCHHNPSAVRELRQDFLDNVEGGDDYDAVYALTEEGRRYLESMKDDLK